MAVIDTSTRPGRPRTVRPAGDALDVPPHIRELCHDLRQPAAALSMLAAAIAVQADLAVEMRARVDHLTQQAERLCGLVHDVLARGQDWQPVDIAALVRAVAASIRVTHATEITVSAEDEAFVLGRRVQLDRLVSNLIDNAARAAGVSGWVLVTVGVVADSVRISVEDNGPGLLRAGGRLSLGLLIVERAVREHNGDCVVSELSPSGTRIEMVFPRLSGDEREAGSL